MDIYSEAEKEKEECTPPVGFNVCEYDPMGRNGDNLSVIKWFEDRTSAEQYADSQRALGATMYVLGKGVDTKLTKKDNSSERK